LFDIVCLLNQNFAADPTKQIFKQTGPTKPQEPNSKYEEGKKHKE